MKKVLITAFEPFGVTGTYVRRANASLAILREVWRMSTGSDHEYLILPVSAEAPARLKDYADRSKPDAILSLGEDISLWPNAVRVEPHARDCPATMNPLAGLLKPRLHSAFVRSAYPENSYSTLMAYHCNAAYRAGLQWSASHGNIPVAFAHVAVIGSRPAQTRKVFHILERLKAWERPSVPTPP